MIKLKDYTLPLCGSEWISFTNNGERHRFWRAKEDFPEMEMTKEMIAELNESSIKVFFDRIDDFKTEKQVKEFVYDLIANKPKPKDRENNLIYVLNLLPEYFYKISEDNISIIKRIAKDYLLKAGDNLISNKSDINKKRGANYAWLNYDKIKKLLPLYGNVTMAVRKFDSSLSLKEVDLVRRKMSKLLNEKGVTPPY